MNAYNSIHNILIVRELLPPPISSCNVNSHTSFCKKAICFSLLLLLLPLCFCSCEKEIQHYPEIVAYYAESQNLPSVTPDSIARFTQKVDHFVVQYPAAKEDPLYPDIIQNIYIALGGIHIYINDEWKDEYRVEF